MFYIRRSDDVAALNKIELATFGADCPVTDKSEGLWWLAFDENKKPVGYCGVSYHPLLPHHPPCAFLSRVGVLKSARGYGLQKRFIRAAERQARKDGFDLMVSYTHNLNSHSANNFIRCGYEVYSPKYLWGLENGIYLQKEL